MTKLSAARKKAINEMPLAQKAYDTVRDAIENGELSPGDRVSEYRVAEWLKISRTPAREGLQRLETEGLLSYRPRRGLVVTTVDAEALKELFHAREVVESALARLAAVNGSGPQLGAIRRHSEAEEPLVDDRETMYQHNKIFHQLITAAAHNRYLAKFSIAIDDIVAADRRGSSLNSKERRHAVVKEHRVLANAISERDAEAAFKAAAAHVKAAYEARMKIMQK